MERRELLKTGLKSLSMVGLASVAGIAKAQDACRTTLEQPEGPFYPIQDQEDKNNDLTKVKGRRSSALGEAVILTGVVQDESCRPIKGAVVDIWQACATGKYNHPSDPNQARLDPDFQYWGLATTNEKGEFIFKTIKPGAYQASADWVRPPHIHMKIHLRGFEELTTQIYFGEEQELNTKDRILRRLPIADQKNVIVDFKKDPASRFGDLRVGSVNITLKGIR